MAVYRANLRSLRTLIKARQTVIGKAIVKLNTKIAAGRTARPRSGTAQADRLDLNKQSLVDAKRVLKALEDAEEALENGCCENTLNCDVETH